MRHQDLEHHTGMTIGPRAVEHHAHGHASLSPATSLYAFARRQMIRRHRNTDLADHLKRIEDRIERLAQLVQRDAAPASRPAADDEIHDRLVRIEAMLQLIYDREPLQRER